MSTTANNPFLTEDRVKLPFQFDADKMLAEIKKIGMNDFIYYNVIQLRAPAHLVDPSLPFPPPADDYADGSWTDWLDTKDLKSSPYLMSVIDTFRTHTKVTLVRILRLAAGNVVKEHTDPTLGLEVEKSVVRLTIPILINEHVDFFLNGTGVDMRPGECWYLRLTDPHSVVNSGATDRINLTIDMIPNDWLRSIILNAQA
uniref:aspartyl/asparaginyl beta-hydroxylase domain-containing protein n=2 Tax=Roseivirga sp. TaxID=1964215 RepID=UPI0040484260